MRDAGSDVQVHLFRDDLRSKHQGQHVADWESVRGQFPFVQAVQAIFLEIELGQTFLGFAFIIPELAANVAPGQFELMVFSVTFLIHEQSSGLHDPMGISWFSPSCISTSIQRCGTLTPFRLTSSCSRMRISTRFRLTGTGTRHLGISKSASKWAQAPSVWGSVRYANSGTSGGRSLGGGPFSGGGSWGVTLCPLIGSRFIEALTSGASCLSSRWTITQLKGTSFERAKV